MSDKRLDGRRLRGRVLVLAAALAGASSAIVAAQDGPESLLPPIFQTPTPAPTPTPTPGASPTPAPTSRAGRETPAVAATRTPAPPPRPAPRTAQERPVEAPPRPRGRDIDAALLEELLELQRPKYDIPPDASRSLEVVGVLAEVEGGLAQADTGAVNGAYLNALLSNTRGPLVSRWGSMLMRRALASRLATPVGMNGADWAALRAQLLLRMGEAWPARALVQEVDSGFYTPALEDAALASYIATADILGICPIAAITAARREGAEWQLVRAICDSFDGSARQAQAALERYRRQGLAKNIDVLLAQKFAGAAIGGRRAVTIEWTGVEELTPWRYGLALATGLEPPEALMAQAGTRFAPITARAPMLPLSARAAAADYAAAMGILSSAAMIDLYSQIYSAEEAPDAWNARATLLRRAYVAADPAARLAAMQELWDEAGNPETAYARRVLTSYAAARLAPAEDFAVAADDLIASMLAAGLDRNAARWAGVVPAGSVSWGLLAVGSPDARSTISGGALDAFHEQDATPGKRRSRFLLAGLSGLRRVDPAAAGAFSRELGLDLTRETRWSRAIEAAAAAGNQPLVVFLAGAGMQGESWDKMTGLHLFHIVSALRRVGLEGEARMIAAEAIARA